ncbi:MAG: maleylacetoacetate isomerase [Burkholderiaceae bacterium]
MKLYNYFRSSASFRVRIALNLKGLPYEYSVVHLTRDGGQQFAPAFLAINPDALIPVLEDDGERVTQSLAIIEYLEETHPQPPLLPTGAVDRAYVRSIALAIACEIHPLNNLRVLRYLVRDLKVSDDQKNAWYRHWVEQGLAAIEARLVAEKKFGRFALGDAVTLADVVIVPQIFNARRFDCRLDDVPTVMGIFDRCMELPAFIEAQPARQPDAE